MSDDPSTWDLSMGVLDGNEQGMVAMVEAVRRYGAIDLEFGYRPREDGSEPAATDPVTWFAKATFNRPVGPLGQRGIEAEAISEPGMHGAGGLYAMAALIKMLGGNVSFVEK